MFAIFWVGDPASFRAKEDSVSPSLDAERESVRVDTSGGSLEAPIVVVPEIDEVQEDDDFWRGDEWTFEVDAHGGGTSGVAHVLAGEKIQVVGCEAEQTTNGVVESGAIPGADVAVSPMPGRGLDR